MAKNEWGYKHLAPLSTARHRDPQNCTTYESMSKNSKIIRLRIWTVYVYSSASRLHKENLCICGDPSTLGLTHDFMVWRLNNFLIITLERNETFKQSALCAALSSSLNQTK